MKYDNTDYELMELQLKEMIGQDPDPIPVLSNASAILMDSMEALNWAGFYLMRGDKLVLSAKVSAGQPQSAGRRSL